MKSDIRRALATDVEELVDLCLMVERQHEAYLPLRWGLRTDIRQRFLYWANANLNSPDWLFAVAVDNGQTVGAAVAAITPEIPIYAYERYAFIHDLAVAASHRRRGIATQLLTYCRQWATQTGVNQLRLLVADQNSPAAAAFVRFGFKTTCHEMIVPLP